MSRRGSLVDRAERKRLVALLAHERRLWRRGVGLVAGVDEAGVGPLAGPVVAAAVILPRRFAPPGIDDSKALDPSTRKALAAAIKAEAVAWAVGSSDVDEIDRINIYQAGLAAMRRAVTSLAVAPDFVLVDARTIPGIAPPQEGIVHGDALSLTVAAASILAKTTRDAWMEALDRRFPGYGFARHKGYPTPAHLEALRRLGPCPMHRRSYAPVRALLGSAPEQGELPLERLRP